MEWETGEITYEPLSVLASDDPITCAVYGKEHDLLALGGWKRFKHLVKHDKTLTRPITQSKIRQVRRSQKYMFGYLIPRNYIQALEFDQENYNSKWYDATKNEMDSINQYGVFQTGEKAVFDRHRKVINSPKGHHKIRAHLVFAV